MINETSTGLTQLIQPFSATFGSFGTIVVLGMVLMIPLFARGFGISKSTLLITFAITALQYMGIIEIGNWIWGVWALTGFVIIFNVIEHLSEHIPRPNTDQTKGIFIYILRLMGIVKIKSTTKEGISK